MGQETENAKAVVDSNQYHALLGPYFSVELGLPAPASGVAASVNPHCHGEFLVRLARCGGPHVQVKAVLAEFRVRHIELAGPGVGGIVRRLYGSGAEGVGNLHSLPGNYGLWFFPTQITNRWRCKRNSLVNVYPFDRGFYALYLSSFNGQDRILCLASRERCRQDGNCQ